MFVEQPLAFPGTADAKFNCAELKSNASITFLLIHKPINYKAYKLTQQKKPTRQLKKQPINTHLTNQVINQTMINWTQYTTPKIILRSGHTRDRKRYNLTTNGCVKFVQIG